MRITPIAYRDACAAFAPFAREPFAVLLDSAAQGGKGRYSYITAAPFCVIEARGERVFVDGKETALDPFSALERELAKYPELSDAPVPFAGGAVGFLGYELGGRLEKLPKPRVAAPELPSMVMGLYDTVIAFDHRERKGWIIARGPQAESKAAAFAREIECAFVSPRVNWGITGAWQPELSRDEAEQCIARIIEYIYAGDIFQANFTQRFKALRPDGIDDFMLYRRLRELSPAPFASFLRCGADFSVAGASPERFLSLDADGRAEAHPIKGTRPRDENPAEDARLARELIDSAKDRAENLMIVDLMRNDLSRVCVPGSVSVPKLCELESFATVHHLTSVVEGQMKPGLGAVDLLRAAFPGGSITGAPKIRAMEIIHEMEPAPRGVYCGGTGWIGFDQAMDMNMSIRTLTMAGDVIFAQAGGGIVADSDPAAEYEESMVKIAPLLRALTGMEHDRLARRRTA